ncbi:Ig-like domain-containing protein [Clostridium sp.]|uniref:Ig-like domain-containing protein n=1 Tax=Clostridium sp. TaxID=1506 RepID=UPI002851EDA0|nr:Ig-like domain-containing protein [Clostridium sp.]MDR3598285.1 Ig-like domain-containing protein [Clostridium sp.]
MKKIIKFHKKFISFFLAVMMIYSMVFTGYRVSAATTDTNNGDWSAESVTLQNTSEAQLMVRAGDIDNFGFGWNKTVTTTTGTGWNKKTTTTTTTIDPFSGVETDVHSFPFSPGSSDPQGTDRIMVVSGYNSNDTIVGTNTDGYTRSTTSYLKTVAPVVLNYGLSGVSVQNATIQMFLDDFQPGNARGVTQGTVQYKATINDVEIPELSTVINNLDESGPIGKLITFQIPQRYLDLIRTGSISLKFDDTTSCTGDGYAIDFVKLLINKTTSTTNTATITGNVKDSNNNNLVGATVSAGGVVTATTDTSGNYELDNVPAGQAIVTASKTGYNSSTQTIPTVIAGGGYTANFTLTSSTPPTPPTITVTPTTTTPTNTKDTAAITYSSDSTIEQYRIDIGGTTGEWKVYTGAFDVTQNCIIEAQGINQYGNSSQISNQPVNDIYTAAPAITTPVNNTVTNSNTPTIKGTAEVNSTVKVYDGTTLIGTVMADGNGNWTLTPSAGLADGIHAITATATATAKNESLASSIVNITIDTTKPAAPVITTPSKDIVTNNNTPTIKGTAEANSTVKVYDGTTLIGTVTADVNGNWILTPSTGLADGIHAIAATATDAAGNVSSQSNTVNITIDKTAPKLTLTPSKTDPTNGTVTIAAAATDNVAVASITTPDSKTVQFNPVAPSNSTTYTVSANGTYTFTATDTAGNVTTQSININNIVISSTNDTSLPNISASLESVTPNPAKSSDEINVKYAINTVPFSLSSGMIDEAEVLVDMSQDMKNNQRFSEVQNGFVNQVINDSSLSGIKLGVVGYNDSVYVGTRSNYSDPKTCLMQQTDENLSGIDKTKFLPLYNLNDANTKDGYRQFYQNGYIYNDISNDEQRQFGSALKVADNVLTNYGTSGAKKAIIIISSGNLTYSDDQINSIIGKGYKIIVLDISNSDNTNIKNTYLKLCGNDFGINGNYYKGTFNDQANYNSVDADMKNVDASLKGVTGVTTLSINDAKLNIDLGENFQAVDGGGLVGSGKVCTVTIPQINFTYNSTTGLWEQYGSIEVNFKVKSESGKYGQLGFGLYTNTDNTTKTNSSSISYTNFYNVATSKIIGTPTINITMDVSAPVITSPKDGTSTSNNKPTISGTGQAGDTVTVYDGTTVIGTATVDSNGNWSLTPATALADGKHVITATQADAAGNESGVSNTVNLTIVLSAPVITSPTDGTSTSSNKPTISGTGQAGDTVTVYDGTTAIGTATVDSNGNWSLTPATALADGNHVITATQADAAGNTSGVSNRVNLTIVPSAPVITSPTDGTSTSNNKPTISGTGQAGDTVTVYDGTTVIGTATVDSNGNWSLTPATALADGNHVITATQTDSGGNVSGVSNTVNITIAPSSILQHGIYSGTGTGIVDGSSGNNVTNGIPVTMAMIVDAESSNPQINWSVDDTAKIQVDNTSFKEYEISDDNTIGNSTSVTLDDSGNITGLTMQKGKRYLIIYTITPVGSDQVTVTATADKTTPVPVTLNIGTKPDLF